MRRQVLTLILMTLLPVLGMARGSLHPEVERTLGFEEYRAGRKQYDHEREKGLQLYLENIEMEKREYAKALEEYRKLKKKDKALEYTPAYKEHLEFRREQKHEYAEAKEEFRKDQKEEKKLLHQANLDPMRELELPENRPRYDVKQRVLYGARSPFGRGSKPSMGGIGSGGSGGDYPTPAPAPNLPQTDTFTPPGFDEFPPPPDDNFDLPPPPPLPPMEGDLSMPPDDFFPPPPPPPPIEDYQF